MLLKWILFLIFILTKDAVHALWILLVNDVGAQIEVKMMIVVQLSVLHFRHLLVDDLVQVVGLKLDLDLPSLFLVAISLQIVFILVDIEGILGLF